MSKRYEREEPSLALEIDQVLGNDAVQREYKSNRLFPIHAEGDETSLDVIQLDTIMLVSIEPLQLGSHQCATRE